MTEGIFENGDLKVETEDEDVGVSINVSEENTTNTTTITTDINGTGVDIILGDIIDDINASVDVDPDVLEGVLGNVSLQNETNMNDTLVPQVVANSSMNVDYINYSNSSAGFNATYNITNTSSKSMVLIAIPISSNIIDIANIEITMTTNGTNLTLVEDDFGNSFGYFYTDDGILLVYVAVDPILNIFLPVVPVTTPPKKKSSSSSSSSSSSGIVLPSLSDTITQSFSNIIKGNSVNMGINNSMIPVTGLEFALGRNASEIKITVKRIVDNPGSVMDAYAFFEITETYFTDDDLDRATIIFKVPKSWLTNNSYFNDEISLFRWENDWVELETSHMQSSGDYEYFKSTSPGFSYFAIGRVAPEEVVDEETVVEEEEQPPTFEEDEPKVSGDVVKDPETEPKDKPISFTWIFIILVFVVIVGVAIEMVIKHNRGKMNGIHHEYKDRSEDIELGHFIKTSLKAGQDKEEVRKNLIDAGWNEETVDHALRKF